jgi:hypothetical protein
LKVVANTELKLKRDDVENDNEVAVEIAAGLTKLLDARKVQATRVMIHLDVPAHSKFTRDPDSADGDCRRGNACRFSAIPSVLIHLCWSANVLWKAIPRPNTNIGDVVVRAPDTSFSCLNLKF